MDNIICLVAGAFIGSLIASVVISAVVMAGRADERVEECRLMKGKSKRKVERERGK